MNKIVYYAITLFLMFALLFVTEKYVALNHEVKHFEMYYLENYEKFYDNEDAITGIYFGDFFAVWVDDRTYSQVMETCNHEWLHHRVRISDWEKNHFEPKNEK